MPTQDRPRFDRDYFDPAVAEHYANRRWSESVHARRTDRREQEIVSGFLRETEPLAAILDIPCGAGRFVPLLESVAPRVICADLSPHMIDNTASAMRIQASADAIPLPDGTVDLAFCFRLVHHFRERADRISILRELARVSRQWVLGSYFDRRSYQAWRNRVKGKTLARFPQTNASFSAEAAEAGLQVQGRQWLARGWSEQVIVLLRKEPAAGYQEPGGRS